MEIFKKMTFWALALRLRSRLALNDVEWSYAVAEKQLEKSRLDKDSNLDKS